MPLANPLGPLDKIETARRKINQIEVKGEEGRLALRFVKDSFAETVDRMIDVPLMSGDPATLQTFEQNREKLAQLRSITRKSPNEDADATVARLTNGGGKIADMANWLVGSSRTQPPHRAFKVSEKLREQFKEEDWGALRQATVARLMQPRMVDGKQLTESESADDFMKFMHGRGERLMNTMFSKKERDLMARIGNTVRLQGKQAAPTVKPMLAQLGAMVAPRMKPPTISPLEFDKRFGAGDVDMTYPVDDAALMEGIERRQRMINSMEGTPGPALQGQMVLPVIPYRP
jgi:hypothetical protein